MSVLYTNNASTTLATGITSSSTSISVSSGKGSLFPAITGSDFFFVTISNSEGTNEIVKVTARSTDTLTVVRGQDGTTAAAWNAGDKVELRVTKGLLDQLKIDAVNGYASDSSLSSHTGNTSNPHSVTATQVGLGNVTNESKATMFTSPTFTGNAVLGSPASGNFSTGTFTWPTFNQNTTGNAATVSSITSSQVTTALGYTPLSTSGTAADSDKLDGQHGSYYQPASTAITTSNIGSQSVSYASSAGNADTVDSLHVHTGRNNEANKVVRTDGNGYLQTGYINSSNGDEGNNSNPSRVWGTNGSDSYLRSYLTSALSVNYANSAGRAYPYRSDGGELNFYWSGQGGQPSWLWGGNDGSNMYVYNPSNFSVNYATTAGNGGVTSVNGSTGAVTVSASPPTDYGAVGTYVIAGSTNYITQNADVRISPGATVAGSTLIRDNFQQLYAYNPSGLNQRGYLETWVGTDFSTSLGLGGTWRLLTWIKLWKNATPNYYPIAFWVRIS